MVQASNFAFDHAAFRNDVGTGAAADFSDVGSGAFIHVALRKLCDCAGGRLDAVDAVLRVETGVGGFSLDFHREGNECRCRVGGCTDRAA